MRLFIFIACLSSIILATSNEIYNANSAKQQAILDKAAEIEAKRARALAKAASKQERIQNHLDSLNDVDGTNAEKIALKEARIALKKENAALRASQKAESTASKAANDQRKKDSDQQAKILAKIQQKIEKDEAKKAANLSKKQIIQDKKLAKVNKKAANDAAKAENNLKKKEGVQARKQETVDQKIANDQAKVQKKQDLMDQKIAAHAAKHEERQALMAAKLAAALAKNGGDSESGDSGDANDARHALAAAKAQKALEKKQAWCTRTFERHNRNLVKHGKPEVSTFAEATDMAGYLKCVAIMESDF